MAKISRKKLPAAAKSSARKPLATSAGKSKPKAAARIVAAARSVAAPRVAAATTTSKGSTRTAVAEKPRIAKVANGRPADARSARPEMPPPRPVPVAVPTDGKPRKNEAGLNARELEHFRDLLLAKRRELVGDMSQMEREALRSSGNSNLSTLPIHMADMGTDNYEQEFTLGLVEKDRNLLREINAALAKIQNGTYGICEGTGKPISKPRLEAQPWARYSIEHARQLERNTFRRMM